MDGELYLPDFDAIATLCAEYLALRDHHLILASAHCLPRRQIRFPHKPIAGDGCPQRVEALTAVAVSPRRKGTRLNSGMAASCLGMEGLHNLTQDRSPMTGKAISPLRRRMDRRYDPQVFGRFSA